MTQTTKLSKVFFPSVMANYAVQMMKKKKNNSDKVQLIPKKKMYVDYKREKNSKEKEVVGTFQINMANVFILNVEMTRRWGGGTLSLAFVYACGLASCSFPQRRNYCGSTFEKQDDQFFQLMPFQCNIFFK